MKFISQAYVLMQAYMRHLVLLFALSGLSSAYANSQLSLDDVYAKVDQYQGSKALWQSNQRISELNIQQSMLRQNPSVAFEQSGFAKDQEREFSVNLSQPIDIFGQRKRNEALALTTSQQLLLQQQLWQTQSELIVQSAWASLVLAEQEKALFADQLQLSQSNLESVQKRYKAGSVALVEVERAEIQHLDTLQRHQQAILKQQAAARHLSQLWGEVDIQLSIDTKRLAWPTQAEQLVQRALAEKWLEQLYALNVQQSKQQIDYLNVQKRPYPTFNVGMTRTQSPQENTDTSLNVGIEIPLNVFNRQQYAIAIAEEQQLLLRQQQQHALKQQILDIANQLNQLKGLKQQFDASRSQIELAERVQQRTSQGFQAGKLNINDVQQTTRQHQDLSLAQLDILRQAWQSALSAQAMSIGTSYEDISRSDAYSQLVKLAASATQDLIRTPVGQ